MVDDPRKNLRWLEQELLAQERPEGFDGISGDTADLLAQVDQLLEETREPEPPAFVGKRKGQSRGEQAERAHISRQFDETAAVLTKTRGQLRKEARKRKIAERKAGVNRNIGGLVVLAALETLGIVLLLGWWLQ